MRLKLPLGGSALQWAALIIVPLVVALIVLTKSYPGLWHLQAWGSMDAADTARQLAEHEGFTTQTIRPLGLLKEAAVEGHPDLYNEPLHPLLLSWLFRAWSPGDRAVAVLSVLYWLAALWTITILARIIFSWRVANLTAIWLGTNITFLGMGISGSGALLAATLLLAALWLIYRPSEGGEADVRKPPLPIWRLAVAGVLVGLATLTEYSLVLSVIPFVVYGCVDQRRKSWWRGFAVLAGWVIVISPWFVRNTIVTGNPVFTLRLYDVASGTSAYPGGSVFRSMDPKVLEEALPLRFAWQHLGQVAVKAKMAVRSAQGAAVTVLGGLVGAFFLASLFFPLGDHGLVRLRRCFYGVFILHFLVLAVTHLRADALAIYVPFATMLAAAGLRRLVGRVDLKLVRQAWRQRQWRLASQPLARVAIVTVIVALGGVSFVSWLRRPISVASEVVVPRFQYFIADEEDNGLVMSDVPEAVAWYADRPATNLTTSRGYDRLAAAVPIDAVNFSPNFPGRITEPEMESWWRVAMESPMPYKGLAQVGGGPTDPEGGVNRVKPAWVDRFDAEEGGTP